MSNSDFPKKKRISKPFRTWMIILLLLLLFSPLLFYIFLPSDLSLKKAVLARQLHHVLLDDQDQPLLFLPNSQGDIGYPVELSEIPATLVNAILAAEDLHFFSHWGISPSSILRAIFQNLKARRVVSGASTITQQLVRRTNGGTRTLRNKIGEAISALCLEKSLTKEEILTAYLNLIPMGGNLEGVGLAARHWFGKSPSSLNLPECALLAALPKSPGQYIRGGIASHRLLLRRNWILQRMYQHGLIKKNEYDVALQTKIEFNRQIFTGKPDHFTTLIQQITASTKQGVIKTTLNVNLQRRIKEILLSHRERLAQKDGHQAAAIIVDAQTSQIKAMVGSLQFGKRNHGFVNGALANRSAGSTLKPFLYALALEDPANSTATIIADTLRSFRTPQGDYLPVNASRESYGPVSFRSALGNSLNIPAIKLLNTLGLASFQQLLVNLKLMQKGKAARAHYGLGMAIGNLEVSLFSLVNAYTVFTNQGKLLPLTMLRTSNSKQAKKEIFSPESTWMVSDILQDSAARTITFGSPFYFDYPWPLAMKTGTSTRYRDCWLISFTPKHIIGIWCGNFDGRPTAGLTGASACGPILQEIIQHLPKGHQPGFFPMPDTLEKRNVCSFSGMSPRPFCPGKTKAIFRRETPLTAPCTQHINDTGFHNLDGSYSDWQATRELRGGEGNFTLEKTQEQTTINALRITYPHQSDRYLLSTSSSDRILLKAESAVLHPFLRWFIDGVEVAQVPPPYSLEWKLERGHHQISVATPDFLMDSITISVE